MVGVFLIRSCCSGACCVFAFETQSRQAFFEGHVHALDWYGGVFATVRYEYVPGWVVGPAAARRG